MPGHPTLLGPMKVSTMRPMNGDLTTTTLTRTNPLIMTLSTMVRKS